jgi:RNA-binding protein
VPEDLTPSQRKYLRSLAHALEPVVWVGEEGLGPGVLAAVREALLTHELVKVRLRQPEDKRALARELSERCAAELCGLVGHTVILYRRHPVKPRIEIPSRPGQDTATAAHGRATES